MSFEFVEKFVRIVVKLFWLLSLVCLNAYFCFVELS